ncbi:MAG: hypothetical protein ABIP63_00015 [Thermoanaerobaculia bacterium]
MRHRFTSLLPHLVFSTKDRVPFLEPDFAQECHAYLGGIIENTGGRRIVAWQKGYAAFSVSKSGIHGVIRYIEHQEEHHRRVTYQEEVRRFLAEHGMESDERFMWE